MCQPSLFTNLFKRLSEAISFKVTVFLYEILYLFSLVEIQWKDTRPSYCLLELILYYCALKGTNTKRTVLFYCL